MKESVTIDPDKVEQAATDLLELMEEFGNATTTHDSDLSNTLAAIDIREFAFRPAHTALTAFWSTRAQGARERLEETAYFMATHAATARANDEDAEADLVTLDAELCVSLDEYTKSDYYEATGTERPASTNPGGVPFATGGEHQAV